MRTVGEIRYAEGKSVPKKKDSQYKPVDRPKQRFAPFKVSKKLEADLPFKSKTKNEPKKSKRQRARDKVSKIYLTAGEKRKLHLLQEMSTITRDRKTKRRKKNAARLEAIQKSHEADDQSRSAYTKEKRKRRYIAEGIRQKKKEA